MYNRYQIQYNGIGFLTSYEIQSNAGEFKMSLFGQMGTFFKIKD